jgi:FSR family fosmidomycin resistance protein-like MFS transporter
MRYTRRMAANSAVAGRWNLTGISVVSFAHGASDFYSGIVPLVIFYDVSRAGLPPWYQGALAFAWYLTSSIVQPIFGAYGDRRGRWWFLPASVGLTVVSVSLAGTTTSLAVLAACIVVGGLGSAVMHPEAGRYTAMLGGSRRASAISIYQIGGQVGYGLGPAVVGLLLGAYGPRGSLFLLIPGVLAVAAILAFMRGIDGTARSMHAGNTPAARTSDPRVDRVGVGLLIASTALRYLVAASFAYYLPNLLTARGLTLAAAGTIVTGFLIFAAVGLFAGGALSDRFGAVTVSVLSLCASVPFLALSLTLDGWLSVVLLMAGSALLAVQNAPGVALAQAMLPRNLGMALGLMNGVAFGVGSAAVTAIGFLLTEIGPTNALLAVSTIPFLSAIAYIFVARRIAEEKLRSLAA